MCAAHSIFMGRSSLFFSVMLLVFLSCSTVTVAKPIYRGVATNAWAQGCSDIQALSRMSWYYNWGLQPTVNCNLGTRVVEYVPMVWGAAQVPNVVANLPADATHLLAFNEPNFSDQANMLPAAAATQWKNVVSQLEEAGRLDKLKLGTPSASPGGDLYDPILWFDQFFGNCTNCRFDFLCFHAYDCNKPWYNGDGLNYWLGQVEKYNLPIWLTEFDCPGDDVSVENEIKWMQSVLPSLDNNEKIERYAWFTARATNVGTVPSLLVNGASTLTQVGEYYNSAGDSFAHSSASSVRSALHPFLSLLLSFSE